MGILFPYSQLYSHSEHIQLLRILSFLIRSHLIQPFTILENLISAACTCICIISIGVSKVLYGLKPSYSNFECLLARFFYSVFIYCLKSAYVFCLLRQFPSCKLCRNLNIENGTLANLVCWQLPPWSVLGTYPENDNFRLYVRCFSRCTASWSLSSSSALNSGNSGIFTWFPVFTNVVSIKGWDTDSHSLVGICRIRSLCSCVDD